MIFSDFRGPGVVGKNRAGKMMRTVFKMRSAGQAGKTAPGGVGPLKTEEN